MDSLYDITLEVDTFECLRAKRELRENTHQFLYQSTSEILKTVAFLEYI